MHVIRHHAPLDQAVALAIEVQQYRLHGFRMRGDSQQTTSMPRILIAGNQPVQLFFPPLFIELSTFQFPLPSEHHGCRQCVRQTKRQRLNLAGGIQMRQISSRMPAFVAKGLIHTRIWQPSKRTASLQTRPAEEMSKERGWSRYSLAVLAHASLETRVPVLPYSASGKSVICSSFTP